MAAPPLVPDTGMTPQASDDSDQGLPMPPEAASQIPTPSSLSRKGSGYPSHTGSQLFIDAPGHPPIPGFMSPTSRTSRDMFAITNALNGLDMSSGGGAGGTPMDGPWTIPGRRGSQSLTTEGTTKKLKPKKSKSSLTSSSGEAHGTSAAKRARAIPPATATSWRSDTGALGGF